MPDGRRAKRPSNPAACKACSYEALIMDEAGRYVFGVDSGMTTVCPRDVMLYRSSLTGWQSGSSREARAARASGNRITLVEFGGSPSIWRHSRMLGRGDVVSLDDGWAATPPV